MFLQANAVHFLFFACRNVLVQGNVAFDCWHDPDHPKRKKKAKLRPMRPPCPNEKILFISNWFGSYSKLETI
jgi:hypothetical protein